MGAAAASVVGCAKSPAERSNRHDLEGDFAHAVGLSWHRGVMSCDTRPRIEVGMFCFTITLLGRSACAKSPSRSYRVEAHRQRFCTPYEAVRAGRFCAGYDAVRL